MVIRRKDGSIYKLRGPNKLLIRQNFWHDEEPVQVHNFDHLAKFVIDVDVPRRLQATSKPYQEPPTPKPATDRVLDAIDEISSIVLDEPKINSSPPTPPPPKKHELTQPSTGSMISSSFRPFDRHLLYCLPAKITTHKDEMYGDVIRRLEYESPFRFQGTIAASSDVSVSYWTTVKQVTERSIVYHSSRYRWWKVDKVSPDPTGDGFILQCTPSDIKPDFSEVA